VHETFLLGGLELWNVIAGGSDLDDWWGSPDWKE